MGTRNPYTYLLIDLEDGDLLYFDRISKGTGYSDAVYEHTETTTRFYKAVIGRNGDGWTVDCLTAPNSVSRSPYSARNIAQGAPTEMLDASGNLLELRRDPQRNLQEIRTPHGRWIGFKYDDHFRVVQAETTPEEWIRYAYNSDGMLTDVTFSSGRRKALQLPGNTDDSDQRREKECPIAQLV